MNSQKNGIQRVSKLVNIWRFGKKGALREDMEAPHPFPPTLPYASPPCGYSQVILSFCNKLVI